MHHQRIRNLGTIIASAVLIAASRFPWPARKEMRHMRNRLMFAMASAAIAAVTAVGPAAAGPPATSAVAVEIQAGSLTGLRPDGSTVVFKIKVVAHGDDASSLMGEGRHFGSGGAHNYWPAAGSIVGDLVTLSGVVTESNNPNLVGSPVEIQAAASTGTMTLTFGPLAGPPYAGRTIIAHGMGSVSIKTTAS
jgi:hypothetical protein